MCILCSTSAYISQHKYHAPQSSIEWIFNFKKLALLERRACLWASNMPKNMAPAPRGAEVLIEGDDKKNVVNFVEKKVHARHFLCPLHVKSWLRAWYHRQSVSELQNLLECCQNSSLQSAVLWNTSRSAPATVCSALYVFCALVANDVFAEFSLGAVSF